MKKSFIALLAWQSRRTCCRMQRFDANVKPLGSLRVHAASNTIIGNTFVRRVIFPMRVTIKGQVTIPQHIREKLGIMPHSEVDFIEEKGRVYLTKKTRKTPMLNRFRRFRGVATVKMSTDEILALTRGEE
jgi:AbrB family looped-hinge helix DNA binding protein